VAPTNAKLRDRARRIVSDISGVPAADAGALLERAGGEVKTAIVMAKLGLAPDAARERLRAAKGFLRKALA
jgi:N-acetylmuramic acid 6-phosphate etherase